MIKLNSRGEINFLLIPVILLALFFIGAAGFAAWAFNSRQDYKNHSDKKAAAAAAVAVKQTQIIDAKQYFEEAKKPLTSYTGPSAFGAITVKYPKNWSAYVIETSGTDSPILGYFHPKFVPDVGNQGNSFALRVELAQQTYDQVMQNFSSQIELKEVSVKPFKLAKVPSVTGSRVEGQIVQGKTGSMIVLPLRNLTLKVWTEANQFKADFDNNILPNLQFTP